MQEKDYWKTHKKKTKTTEEAEIHSPRIKNRKRNTNEVTNQRTTQQHGEPSQKKTKIHKTGTKYAGNKIP